MNLILSGWIGAREVEAIFAEHWYTSNRRTVVTFDLRAVDGMDVYATALVAQWATALAEKTGPKVAVTVQLADAPSPLMMELWVYSGLSTTLAPIRVMGPPRPVRDRPAIGQWTRLSAGDHMPTVAHQARVQFATFGIVGDVESALRTMVSELGENGVVHGLGRGAAFLVRVVSAATSALEPRKGVFGERAEGTRQLEVYVGDRGPGLLATLAPHVPPGFGTTGDFKRLTPDERVLAYAFEFGSTSNKDGRRDRIRTLLATNSVPSVDSVATGLFKVREVVRRWGGQFVVRSQPAVLSVGFDANGSQRYHGSADLGLTPTCLPGTHMVLRLPLVARSPAMRQTDSINAPVHVIDLASQAGTSESMLGGIDELTAWFASRGGQTGTALLLCPSIGAVLPRAAAALQALIPAARPSGTSVVVHAPGLAVAASAASSDRPRPRTWWGDLVANEFVELGDLGGRVLATEAVELLRAEYKGWIEGWLKGAMATERLIVDGARFLVDGRYYTTEFVDLEPLLRPEFSAERIADWMALTTSPRVSHIVAVGAHASRLASALAQRLGADADAPEVVPLAGSGRAAADRLSLVPRTSVLVVTDVIGSGASVRRALDLLGDGGGEPTILSVVDTRTAGHTGYVMSGTHRVRTLSVATHPVPMSAATNHLDDSEYVEVDPRTQRPTRREGRRVVALSAERLLGSAAEVGALRTRHWEHSGRHYSVFLDLQPLFRRLADDIRGWVSSCLESNTEGAPSDFLIYDPDKAFGDSSVVGSGSVRTDIESRVGCRARDLCWDELTAPPVRAQRSRGGAIVLIPAMASGRTARHALRYALAEGASWVLLLVALSRMDPDGAAFVTQLSALAGVPVQVSVFSELQVPSYEPGPLACPMCHEEALLTAKLFKDGDADLALQARVLGPWRLRRTMDVPLNEPRRNLDAALDPDLDRAVLRDAYGRAGSDSRARITLNSRLVDEESARERFVEVMAYERQGAEFTPDQVRHRIQAPGFAALETFLLQVVLQSSTGYPVGRYAAAAAHLLPTEYLDHLSRLIRAHVGSDRDICQLILGAAATGRAVTEPWPFGDDRQDTDGAELWRRLRPDAAGWQAALGAIQTIKGNLTSSTPLFDELPRLPNPTDDAAKSWNVLVDKIGRVANDWRRTQIDCQELYRFAPLRQQNEQSGALGELRRLGRAVGDLEAQARGTFSPEHNDALRARVVELAREVKAIGETLYFKLEEFTPDPWRMALRASEELKREDGIVVSPESLGHERHVFFSGQVLIWAIKELVRNATKAVAHAGLQSPCRISVAQAGAIIRVCVGDPLPVESLPPAMRGRLQVQARVLDFGGTLSYEPDGHGGKWAVLQLRSAPI